MNEKDKRVPRTLDLYYETFTNNIFYYEAFYFYKMELFSKN